MNKISSSENIDGLILFFILILANLRASIFVHLFPDTSVLLGPAWIEIALWFIVFLAMTYHLVQKDQLRDYLSAWRRGWLLALFLLLALLSVFWSVHPVATLFRFLELAFATLLGAYIGIRYRPTQLLEILFWFGAVVLILSIAMALAAPGAGTMYWAPFNGAWRGLFWHRNHLSSLAALLSIVFLCRTLMALERRDGKGLLDLIFYVLSIVVLFFAKSATGYILFISLNFLVLCSWSWLKLRQRLRAWHYFGILGVFAGGLALILLNLDFVLGLFNRNTTLTGRVGLWKSLLEYMVVQRPWWGHGFGAVWMLDSFRESIRQFVGWPSQPLIADNGFLDILLHLGIVGLVLLVALLAKAVVQSFRFAIAGQNLADFFPLLFFGYVVIANISFSMLAETEVFVWLLIVSVVFMASSFSGQRDEEGQLPGSDLNLG